MPLTKRSIATIICLPADCLLNVKPKIITFILLDSHSENPKGIFSTKEVLHLRTYIVFVS